MTEHTDRESEPKYLFTTHGDGAFSVIVTGFDNIHRKLIESMYGDRATPDEAQYWRDHIEDEGNWTTSFDFGLWHLSIDFEDGAITVQRISQ